MQVYIIECSLFIQLCAVTSASNEEGALNCRVRSAFALECLSTRSKLKFCRRLRKFPESITDLRVYVTAQDLGE